MLKLLIADCNEEFRLSLAEALQDRYQVLCCSSGKEALALLLREQPDLFVLELMLPEMDGITLLEHAAAEGCRPKVLAATPLLSDYVLDSAQRLGIGYLIRKPCDIASTVTRIDDLCRNLNVPASKRETRFPLSPMLLSLSISAKHKGFSYLMEAITSMERNPVQSITKELYPAVAKRFGCQKGHVERSIRSALESAWDRRDPAVWEQFFPEASRRPTNAQFICRITEAMRQIQE